MGELIGSAVQEIKKLVDWAVQSAAGKGLLPSVEPLPEYTVEIPADTSYGDFAANAAMVYAKAFRMPPRKIGEILRGEMRLEGSMFQRAKIAGPGFLNFFLSGSWFASVLEAVLAQGERYGRTDYGGGEKIVVEFVSANPTGPMHMGNARGGALGDCLAAVLDWAGYDVTREFYINDAGNQIEKFADSLEARYLQIYRGEEAVPFPEDGYHGEDITLRAKEFADLHGDQFLSEDSRKRRDALVAYALPANIEKLRKDLEAYRIQYDVWFPESSLHESGAVLEVIKLLKEKGLAYEKDGAVWYRASAFGGEKDEVLVRANGIPTYFAADIAYHRNKFVQRGFSRAINIWGADHHGHVARLKGAMDAIGLDGNKLDIVLMQFVRLVKDGKPVKMSKRTGKAVSLTDLLEDVPVDAARFFFNMREPNSTLDFDLDLAVEESAQNPVYYVQYAHARICSILKNLKAEGIAPRPCQAGQYLCLDASEERELIRKLARFPAEIREAAIQYDPARITRYALDLAALFHRFYSVCRVKGEREELLQARLALCLAVRTTLKNILGLMKIAAPETM